MAVSTKVWHKRVLDLFETELSERVFTTQKLAAVLESHRERLELPLALRVKRFITFLEEEGQLELVKIQPEQNPSLKKTEDEVRVGYRAIPRYVWGDASAFEVALSLRPRSYLSHASAVFLHGLTTQIPKTVYVNQEQSPKPTPSGGLSQQRIDHAFRSRPRLTNYVFAYRETRLVLLNGKHTGNLEVTEFVDAGAHALSATKLERTLIDITVRPTYAGGVFDVLEAFRGARERASVATLVATLAKLDYVYPYHQALGFYLERAGFPANRLQRFTDLGLKYDFYLANQMPNPQHDPRWRIYYPEGLWDGIRA